MERSEDRSLPRLGGPESRVVCCRHGRGRSLDRPSGLERSEDRSLLRFLVMLLANRVFVVAAASVVMLSAITRLDGQTPAVRMIEDEGEAAQYWARWRGPSGQG